MIKEKYLYLEENRIRMKLKIASLKEKYVLNAFNNTVILYRAYSTVGVNLVHAT